MAFGMGCCRHKVYKCGRLLLWQLLFLSMNNSLTIVEAFFLMWKESCKVFNNFHWEVWGRNNIWPMYIQGPTWVPPCSEVQDVSPDVQLGLISQSSTEGNKASCLAVLNSAFASCSAFLFPWKIGDISFW